MLRTQQEDRLDFSNPYNMFKYSIRNELTRKYYERRLRRFFDFINFDVKLDIAERCNNFVNKSKNEASSSWVINQIIEFLQFQKNRVEAGEITASTLRNFVKALKLFCEMSDIVIPWKRITRGLPRARMAANDRAPTLEEIQKICEYPDSRIKAIIYTMASSGIRLGVWDSLRWKHIIPINNENGDIIAAKIIVYGGDSEEYYAFMTPEAYRSLKEWIDFRTPLSSFMSKPIISIQPNCSIRKAMQLMNSNNMRRLVIVDTNNKMMGIITENDIFRQIAMNPNMVTYFVGENYPVQYKEVYVRFTDYMVDLLPNL